MKNDRVTGDVPPRFGTIPQKDDIRINDKVMFYAEHLPCFIFGLMIGVGICLVMF